MPAETSGFAQLVEDSQYATVPEEDREEYKAECEAVKQLWTEYEEAREFDKEVRAQYAIDCLYASGKADQSWVVNTNLIGSYIDILTSFLYARNPDVSVKKAPQVIPAGSKDIDQLARTIELVVSYLWKHGRLKPAAKKQVRGSLSTGPGWLKVVMIADGPGIPQMQTQLNDIRDNIARLNACAANMEQSQKDGMGPEQIQAELTKYNELQNSITQKIEVTLRKGLAIDYVSGENMQVSLDVAAIEDHIEGSWNGNAIFKPKTKLKELFPRLTDAEIKGAKCYYQKRPTTQRTPITDRVNLGGDSGQFAGEAEQYTTESQTSGSGQKGREFAKVVEVWDKDTGHIKTMIEGVHRWAVEPYPPPYPSTRFYPYFYLGFYECDGERHPQSLSWRLAKLQDEYARSRSNFRLTRERSIPGVVFNDSAIGPEQARKLERSVHQEWVGITPTTTDQPLSQLFAEKPVAQVDMRLYDNAPILADMEKIAGVQEALQASVTTPKTATEAEIQQSGFASRTSADRDTLETMLGQLAQYTAEVALGALKIRDVQRICGPGAFWPEGMPLEDLLTLAEVDIQAGTTGKPKAEADQQAWGIILPQIKEAIIEIQNAIITGNIPLANAIKELIRETMLRFGDDTDIDRFIPQIPEVPVVPGLPGEAPGAPPAGDPAAGNEPAPPADPSAPPDSLGNEMAAAVTAPPPPEAQIV